MKGLAFAMVFLTGLVVFGCKSYVEIKNPPEGYRYIYTPYDLKVVHTGCGTVKPDTFVARLEYDPTGHEDDITSAFTDTTISSASGNSRGEMCLEKY